MRTMTVAIMLLLLPAVHAAAQTSLVVGGGVTSMWDDETFLGRGALVSGGVSRALNTKVSVEGEFAAASHHRDAGYLAADGTLVTGAARVHYTFGDVGAGVRPFAGVGAAVIHSTGTLNGAPGRRDWTLTQGGLELGGGVLVRATDRLSLRPEFRWTTSIGSSTRSTVEPPIWILRPSMSLVWRIG